uniref:Uncharacterized protein n=1 Tax=Timema poppense TaxID=170557 RepID=A0A7R9H0G4_TIMPO|nr:unnamed protein product [Timema poppensis]
MGRLSPSKTQACYLVLFPLSILAFMTLNTSSRWGCIHTQTNVMGRPRVMVIVEARDRRGGGLGSDEVWERSGNLFISLKQSNILLHAPVGKGIGLILSGFTNEDSVGQDSNIGCVY